MIGKMNRTARRKAAIFFAAFYAFVMPAPHAALTLDAVAVLHCLNDVAAVSAPDHVHGAPTQEHAHDKIDTNHDHAG
jgi:hypothetical protein